MRKPTVTVFIRAAIAITDVSLCPSTLYVIIGTYASREVT
jgi:hypothetical protein